MKSIFVVGTPRSGTTYLARAMSLPDRMAYLEESGMFSLYGARRFPAHTANSISPQPNRFHLFNYVAGLTDAARGKDRLEDLLRLVWKSSKLHPHGLTPSQLLIHKQEIVLTPEDLSEISAFKRKIKGMKAPEIYRAVAGSFLKRTGKDVFIEKTPYHIQYVSEIHDAFPEALVVCIIRQKKDAIASYMNNFESPKKLGICQLPRSWRLKQFIRECNRDARLEEWISVQPYCHVVRFEEFIRNPYGQAVQALDVLGLGESLQPFRPLFEGREPETHWNSLTPRQQETVNRYLKDCGNDGRIYDHGP